LPAHIDEQEIRKIAGVKHVIEATVDVDNMKGICTGTGRVKLRIGEGENLDQVRVNYLNKGFEIKDRNVNNKK
jgi:hypothetical protein